MLQDAASIALSKRRHHDHHLPKLIQRLQAIEWFQKAADQGDADSQYELGLLLHDKDAAAGDVEALTCIPSLY